MLFMLGAAEWVQVGQLAGIIGSTVIQIFQMMTIKDLLNNMFNGAWLLDQARKWGLYFDKILIEFSDKAYYYFEKIVGGTLITPTVTEKFMSRIYIIVGIFIFFKLAMVAIKYMINPEQFLDDKLGAQTLVKRVILGSIIIILIPFIFSTANKLQTYIIEDRVIEKIILPRDAYNELTKRDSQGNKTSDQGKRLAMMVFNGFFGWNEAVPHESANRIYNAYSRVVNYDDVSSFDQSYMNTKVGDEYVISYVPIISTLAVGYLLFMLIKYAMEAAFRSFKLVFMQLLSPFVIVNYMLDPSQEEVMKKWVNATVSTYLMIFIRVMTLWFASLVCYYLKNGIPLESGETSLLNEPDALLKALIVLGLFAFLKDLPKIISEIFGYNLQENEAIGGIMSQGVGVLKGFALGRIGLDFAQKQMNYNILSSGVGAAGSAAGTVGRTMVDMKGQNKGKIALTAATSAGSNLGQALGGMTSTMGQTLSTSMSSTILSPIAQSGSIAASADKMHHGMAFSPEPSDPAKAEAKKRFKEYKQSQYNEFSNNVFNSPSNLMKSFISGDKIDLQNRVIGGSVTANGGPLVHNNPVVQQMSQQVYDRLPSKGSETLDTVTARINSVIGDKNVVADPSSCTKMDITRIMDRVTSDIAKGIAVPTITPTTNTSIINNNSSANSSIVTPSNNSRNSNSNNNGSGSIFT